MKSKFRSPDDSPGFLLWKITIQWQKKQREALRPLKLTHLQFAVLASLQWLTKQNSPVTQSHISKMSKIDKMVVSETIQKLVNKKLVNRKKNKEDSRSYSLTLTSNGHKIVDKALPIVEAVDTKFFNTQKTIFSRFHKISCSY